MLCAQCADNNGKLVEGEIIKWVNEKLGEAGKNSMIRSFQVRLALDMRQCQVEVQVLAWVQKMDVFGKHILRTKIVVLRFLD